MNSVLTGASLPSNSISCNSVLKNTFMLLAATFAFSTITGMAAILFAVPYLGPWVTLGVYMGILFLLHMNANNGLGVMLCFALTGWLGLTLGPILSSLLVVNPMVVVSSFTLATMMFVGLSAYALISKKDFSYMGAFLTTGLLIAFIAGLVAIFLKVTILSLMVSAAFVILSSGVILWQVSQIVNGGETNYVLATVTLFVSFYNIFLSLINILGFGSD